MEFEMNWINFRCIIKHKILFMKQIWLLSFVLKARFPSGIYPRPEFEQLEIELSWREHRNCEFWQKWVTETLLYKCIVIVLNQNFAQNKFISHIVDKIDFLTNFSFQCIKNLDLLCFAPIVFYTLQLKKLCFYIYSTYNVNDSISNFDFVITPRNLPNPGRGVTAVQRKYMKDKRWMREIL